MPHFTFRIRDGAGGPGGPGGDLLAEIDLTLHDLIPLVRHLTRRLAAGGRGQELAGYRAVVTPRYGGVPLEQDLPAAVVASDAPPAPDEPLRISEQDLDVHGQVSYREELEAYYNPGTSSLCTDCPERHRCPGSGLHLEAPVGEWIVLDPAAPRSKEPVAFLTLRLESAQGALLYQRDFRLVVLRFFLLLVMRLLHRAGRLEVPASGLLQPEIIVHHDGQPRLDPLLVPENRPRILARARPLVATAGRSSEADGRRRLVDWERLDAGAGGEGDEPPDLDIKILASAEPAPLARRPPPGSERVEEVGAVDGSPLRVFLSRSVLGALQADRRTLRADLGGEVGGILVGDAFLDADGDAPWVEIVGAIPALDELGKPVKMTLDFHLLRPLEERMSQDFPHHRTVGWYRFHRFGDRHLLVQAGDRLLAADLGERLLLLPEESFMHRNFFAQPWHVGLIIDALSGETRFYRRDGERVVACSGYHLLD
jgi:hypothetical protein